MHCSNCGSYVVPGVRFCSGCGAPAIDPEATQLARTQNGLPLRQTGEMDGLEHTVFTLANYDFTAGVILAVVGAVARSSRWLINVPLTSRSHLLLPCY